MAATASTALWYASRSTGVVALVLLTIVVALGIAVSRKRSVPGLPRFATTSLHRNLSLLSVAFLAVHISTAIADPYVTIGIAAAIVPFTSAYKTVWLGLGAVSVDVIIALVVTSLLRGRIGRRTWRSVHWLSYAAWPVALLHSIGSSTDMQHGYLLWLAIACSVVVVGATSWRLVAAVRARARAGRPGPCAARRSGSAAADCGASDASLGWCPVSPVATASEQAAERAALRSPGLPRLLPGAPGVLDLADHLRLHGPLPLGHDQDTLVTEVARAGLTGRGGAAFPTWRKLAAVRAAAHGDAVAVANGAEGEPASRKDMTLLWREPHLVLDGLQLAALVCGATSAMLYVRSGQPELHRRLHDVIAGRRGAGADRVDVQLVACPPRFLAGEETALVAHVNGRIAAPGYKDHHVFERGIGRRPTLVQNVETLAHMALIARHGAAWFRAVGTADEPGSMLCTVLDASGRGRVAETSLGTSLGTLVHLDEGVQAVLVGGYHGGWLPVATARGLSLSNAALKPAGAFTGAGVLAVLPTAACGLSEAANVARYLALESAGQCGPCLNGLASIAVALAAVARPRPAPAELANLARWATLVTGRGACHHPDGTARFVTSALRVFAGEIAEHSRGRCRAAGAASFLPVPAAIQHETAGR